MNIAKNPLKILLVLENAGAGSGRHVLNLTEGLLRRGHFVTILYSPSRVETWFTKTITALPGLITSQIDMVRGPSLYDIKSLIEIHRYLVRHGPFDIIHGHSSKGGALARLAAIGIGCRRIYTPHAFFTMDPALTLAKRSFYRILEIILSKCSDAIICVSQYEYDHGMALGLGSDLLRVVNNGLSPLSSPDRNTARLKLGLAPEDICIGFVGRLVHQKAVERLVECFSRIHLEAPGARLAIIGSSQEEDAYREMAHRFQVSDKIIWAGQANGPSLMAGFDIFALPSRYEAFPYVLLEAGMRRLPIITMRVGGVDEIVQHGVNGYIVPQGNLNVFAARLLELCKNDVIRRSMGYNSSEIVEKFSVDRMVEETLKIYRND